MGIRSQSRVRLINSKLHPQAQIDTSLEAWEDMLHITPEHQENHKKIFNKLIPIFKKNNSHLILVGGYNRDLLREGNPQDLDFATNASPEDILDMLESVADRNEKGEPSVWDVGAEWGTIAAQIDGEKIEITTYRVNEKYAKKSRKPGELSWGDSFRDDSARRDFTINSIGYDLIEDGFLDYFGGLKDLKNGIIKTVGNPVERFQEDPLRIMRAARFAAQLNYEIEPQTLKAMKKCAPLIADLSAERKRDELTKILLTDNPKKGISYLVDSYAMEYIIPEIMDMVDLDQPGLYHDKDVYKHTLAVVDAVDNDFRLRWAALLHDIGKPNTYSIDDKGTVHFYGHQKEGATMAAKILTELKVPKQDIVAIKHMVSQHMYAHSLIKGLQKSGVNVDKISRSKDGEGISEKTIDKFVNNLDLWKKVNGEDVLVVSAEDILKLNRADIIGGAPRRVKAGLKKHAQTTELVKDARERRDNPRPKLPINGNELMKKFKLPQGPNVGKTLKYLNKQLLEGNLGENEPDRAYSLARQYLINECGWNIIDSPLDGNEIMKILQLPPGPKVGKYLSLLKKEVEKGNLSVTDKDKAEKFLRNLK